MVPIGEKLLDIQLEALGCWPEELIHVIPNPVEVDAGVGETESVSYQVFSVKVDIASVATWVLLHSKITRKE